MTSEYQPLLQLLGLLTLLLVAATIATSVVVHRRTVRNMLEPWAFKAVLVTGILLSVASFIIAAVVGIADENALITIKDHSFAAEVSDAYGASVEPGITFSNVKYQIATSKTDSTNVDFLIGNKLTKVTVKQVSDKWLLFDASGNELPRVHKV